MEHSANATDQFDNETSKELPTLSLVVLQARDIEAAREFYSRLGLSFVVEQHGTGPRHDSTTLGQLVFEIYPCRADIPSSRQRVGFRVPSVDETVETLRRRGTRFSCFLENNQGKGCFYVEFLLKPRYPIWVS